MTIKNPTDPTCTDCEQEAILKVGNYKSSIFEAVSEAKHYITYNDCKFLSIDISKLNLIDAVKMCILSSTFHYSKYCNGKIKWIVKDEITKEQIELLSLDNTEVEVKIIKHNYADIGCNKRKLYVCK